MERLTITDMRQTAQLKGGKCLSKEYINQTTSLAWMCEKGHTWDAPYTIVKQGGWCVQCTKDEIKGEYLNRLNEIAASKGGKCLSKNYINSGLHLLFQCKYNHTWKAKPLNIQQGHWCPHCAGSVRLTLSKFKDIAIKKGGKCISKTYINKDRHLNFKCKKGHTWKATPRNIMAGTWCPHCNKERSKQHINYELAKHVKARFLSAKQGEISHKKLAVKGGIEMMQQLAAVRKGKCLSTTYIHGRVKLKWQCKKTHVWMATPEAINAGSWCPHCAGNAKGSIEKMQEFAKAKGGKCLSVIYVSSLKKLKWQCAERHKWETTPAHISRGSWCPECGGINKITIDALHKIAESRQGKCLSKTYVNRHGKIKWQCKAGHKWQSTFAHASRGTWCPVCGDKEGAANRKKFMTAARAGETL